MHAQHFDRLVGSCAASGSRRSALRAGIAAFVASTLGFVVRNGSADAAIKSPRARKQKHKTKAKAGPPGPAGPPGSAGPPGPAATANITIVGGSFDIATGTFLTATSTCTTGVAIGGGGALTNPECHVFVNGRATATRWDFGGRCPSGQASASNRAHVICLS